MSLKALRFLQRLRAAAIVGALLSAGATPCVAGDRLIGTAGVSQIEGSAGGGLSPWALIAGYGTRDQIGGNLYRSQIRTNGGFTLSSTGAAVGLMNRLELSVATLDFGLSNTVPGQSIGMDVVGAKLRVFGDAVYDQDQAWPQIAIGAQYKRNNDFDLVPKALGANRATGTDLYLSATKVWLAGLAGFNVALNGTLRYSSANQFGLLGFGAAGNEQRRFRPEVSAAVFLRDDLVTGAEHRAKNNNLAVFREQSAADVFIAWFPVRALSLTLAYLNLGNIADKANQSAWYVSAQLSY